MSLDQQFVITVAIVFAYVSFGNYVYFTKVLPTLHEAGLDSVPAFLPSGQARHVREFVRILETRGQRGPLFWVLKANPMIQIAIVVMFAGLVVREFRQR